MTRTWLFLVSLATWPFSLSLCPLGSNWFQVDLTWQKNSSWDKTTDFLSSTMNEHGSWHLLQGWVSILISFNLKWFDPQRKSVRVSCVSELRLQCYCITERPEPPVFYTACSAFVNCGLITVKSFKKWRPQFHKVYANVITFKDMSTRLFLLF